MRLRTLWSTGRDGSQRRGPARQRGAATAGGVASAPVRSQPYRQPPRPLSIRCREVRTHRRDQSETDCVAEDAVRSETVSRTDLPAHKQGIGSPCNFWNSPELSSREHFLELQG